MGDIFAWIMANKVAVVAIVLGAIRLAECIAELTPKEWDNNLIAKIKAILRNFLQFDTGK